MKKPMVWYAIVESNRRGQRYITLTSSDKKFLDRACEGIQRSFKRSGNTWEVIKLVESK